VPPDGARAPERDPTISDAALDGADCLFVVLDVRGRIVRLNPAATGLSGWSSAEMRGACLWDALVPAEEAAAVEAELARVVATRSRSTSEHHWLTRTGARRHITWSMTPIAGPEGEVALVIASGVDVTEQRRAEVASGLLQRVAMASNEATSTDAAFAAVLEAVCHELGWVAGRAWIVDQTGELAPTGRWHLTDAARLAGVVGASDDDPAPRGHGLPGVVRLARQPLWADWESPEDSDSTRDGGPPAGNRARLAQVGVRSAFALPVLVGHEVAAVLEFFAESPTAFDSGLIDLMRHVGTQLGRVVERAKADQEAVAAAQAESARLAAIVQTQLDIATSGGDLGRVMLLVVERVHELTGAEGACLELMDGSEGELVVRAASGMAVPWMGSRRLAGSSSPVVGQESVSEPVLHNGQAVGALRVVSSERSAFADRDVATVRVLAGLAAVAIDQAAAVHRLRQSEDRFRKAFDDAPIGMALAGLTEDDKPGSLLQVNRALAAMTGCSEAELLAGGLMSVVHPEDVLAVRSMLRTVASNHESPCRSERRFLRPDGQVAWVSLSASAVLDSGYAIVQVEDISQRKEAEAKLTEMALHDPLTGLPNRLLLLDRLQRSLARARRRQTQVALLFCDLDRFKVINDSLGHDTGDALLVALARRLEVTLREQDTAARLGGDEFVVVCEDVADEAEAVALGLRLQDVLGEPCMVGDNEVVVTTSIGIVLSTGYASPYALLRDADAAMYRAKESGRARVEVFDQALATKAIDRLQTENGLRRALEQDELRVHYQPIFGLRTGMVEGFEALLRWEHPERGLISPDEFLDVAEETGLIVPIGTWVLEESCRQLAEWRRRFPSAPPWSVAVNLSARQVARPGLAAVVAEALRGSGIDPSWLCLELTESVLIEATTPALAMLRSLKALGVRLAIDDFGTGYSSLSYLRRFPVDVVKVDRSFVAGLGIDGEDDAIVAAVVGLTQRLGLRAVAEGVETEDQATRLRDLGCDLGQGFLFARPLPPEDITPLLADAAAASA
jgi:diguanylate cyclase (GGDEF)-like protein/PAS domain S-box-containing protein